MYGLFIRGEFPHCGGAEFSLALLIWSRAHSKAEASISRGARARERDMGGDAGAPRVLALTGFYLR